MYTQFDLHVTLLRWSLVANAKSRPAMWKSKSCAVMKVKCDFKFTFSPLFILSYSLAV